ncbi:MAG: ABC transporter ATP-binding protein [Bryobacterales bacterium]|nr:ABC transporter ATP-binding protein [Bryobacterales bacterium]
MRRYNKDLLEAKNITKTYSTAGGPVPVLENVNLTLQPGGAVSIMGPSGSGKSTLLYILGVLESPTSGTVTLEGDNPFSFDEARQAAFRNKRIGFLFQDHCLLPQCSVLENVLTPALVDGAPDAATRARAEALIEQVGLRERMHHRPGELSGGEKQRAALARALIREPLLLLCDEPTGNLDQRSAATVADLLLDLHTRRKNMLVVVTHSAELAGRFPERLEMHGQTLRRR